MLIRNTNTGAFEVFDISNNQITSAASMGQVGLEWSVAGIAADPPGGAPNSQLVQAMASYAPTSGALDTGAPTVDVTTQASSSTLTAVPASHVNSA